jgi:hypothetical protein
MIVYQLTPEQADSIRGVEFVPDNIFNPIQDANDTWIITEEEVSQCSIDWVKELPKIEFIPKQIDFI